MKYKVGDKVKVRSDLKFGNSYGETTFVKDMLPTLGKYVTIESINNQGTYTVEESIYNFTDEMLEQPILTVNSDGSLDLDTKEDVVNRPKHYTQGKIEVIDFIEDQKLDFRAANVIKYTCRARYKGKELEDLKKARFYLDRMIKELECLGFKKDGV